MRRLLLLLINAATAQAQYTVRIVTVSAPELPAVRAAMLCTTGDDGGLRQELLPYFTEPVSDLLFRCGEGRSKLEGRVETPYVTEFDPPVALGQPTLPSAFTTRNVGTSAEVTVEAGVNGKPPVISVAWERIRDAGRSTFPLLTSPSTAPIEQPRFITDRISTRLTVTPGQWRLAGMVRPVEMEPAAAPRTLLTFVQVHGATPAKTIAAPREGRLHLLTFCVPAAEGMKLATRAAGDDAALLDRLLQRAESGEITLARHAALAPPPVVPLVPSEHAATLQDPFAAENSAAEAASFHEFPYATEFRPDPRAFSVRTVGHQFSLRGSALEGEATHDPPRLRPLSPQPEAAAMVQPEFAVESLKLHAGLPPGAARLVSVILQPDNGGPRTMHLHFLKSAGPSAPDTGRHSEIHAAAFSLPAAEVSRLSGLSADMQEGELDALMASGAAQLIAWQGVAGEPGEAAAQRYTETPSPAGGMVKRAGNFLIPSQVQFHTLGNMMELRFTEASPVMGTFSITLNSPPPPVLAAFETAAQDGVPLPAFEQKKLVYPAEGGGFPLPKPGGMRLCFPKTAGNGHLEVVLLLRTVR